MTASNLQAWERWLELLSVSGKTVLPNCGPPDLITRKLMPTTSVETCDTCNFNETFDLSFLKLLWTSQEVTQGLRQKLGSA